VGWIRLPALHSADEELAMATVLDYGSACRSEGMECGVLLYGGGEREGREVRVPEY